MLREVLCLSAFLCAGALADTKHNIQITLDGKAAGLENQQLLVDGDFAGFVGDTLTLSAKQHQVSVRLPQGIYAEFMVDLGGIKPSATASPTEECVSSNYLTLKDWGRPEISGKDGAYIMHLQRAEPRSDGNCGDFPSNMQCVQTPAYVDVQAEPEVHAEIWIDGKNARVLTANRVSVPICGNSKTSTIVLRAKGYANCSRKVDLHSTVTPAIVRCPMFLLSAGTK